jgi:hypothetical protein
MMLACKVLRINLEDLEVKTFDDFLQKQYEEIYERGGEEELSKVNLPQLARIALQHWEKKRQLKI